VFGRGWLRTQKEGLTHSAIRGQNVESAPENPIIVGPRKLSPERGPREHRIRANFSKGKEVRGENPFRSVVPLLRAGRIRIGIQE